MRYEAQHLCDSTRVSSLSFSTSISKFVLCVAVMSRRENQKIFVQTRDENSDMEWLLLLSDVY